MLPDINSDWPPKPYDEVFRDIEKWAKLWKGTGPDFSNYQPTNKRGRFKRAADAFFNTSSGQQEGVAPNRQIHIPLAGDIYRTVGNLMFANGVTFTTGAGSEEDIADDDLDDTDEQDPVAEALDKVVNTDKNVSLLTAAAESGSALGGYVLRVVWDKEINPHVPWLDRVEADHCIPEFKWGQLVSVLFWSQFKGDGDVIFRHFQEYGRGFIRHAMYEGTATNVGRPIPLGAHKATQGLVSTVDDDGVSMGDGVDEEGRIATGADEFIAAVYVPNRLPNPAWRDDERIRDFGMSDTPMDVLPLLSMADEVWGSLMRDVDQAKGRVIIPQELLDYLGPGQGSTFDYDRELFVGVGTAVDQEGRPVIEQVQFEIRVEEHLNTYAALLKEILRRCGISPLTFGITDEGTAVTATEIRSQTRDTLTTIENKRRLTSPELTEIMTVLLTIYSQLWSKPEVLPTEDIDINWPDIVQESPREVNESVQMLFAAQSASISARVERVNPTWPPARVKSEVEKIKEEFGIGQTEAVPGFAGGESAVDPETGEVIPADEDVPPEADPNAPPPAKNGAVPPKKGTAPAFAK